MSKQTTPTGSDSLPKTDRLSQLRASDTRSRSGGIGRYHLPVLFVRDIVTSAPEMKTMRTPSHRETRIPQSLPRPSVATDNSEPPTGEPSQPAPARFEGRTERNALDNKAGLIHQRLINLRHSRRYETHRTAPSGRSPDQVTSRIVRRRPPSGHHYTVDHGRHLGCGTSLS
jgi:hypothetical protein